MPAGVAESADARVSKSHVTTLVALDAKAIWFARPERNRPIGRDLWTFAMRAADRRVARRHDRPDGHNVAARVATTMSGFAPSIEARRRFNAQLDELMADVQRRQVAGGMPPFADSVVRRWKAARRREWARRALGVQPQGGAS